MTRSVVKTVTYPQTRNGRPELRTMRLRVLSIMRLMSAMLSAAFSCLSSIAMCFCVRFMSFQLSPFVIRPSSASRLTCCLSA